MATSDLRQAAQGMRVLMHGGFLDDERFEYRIRHVTAETRYGSGRISQYERHAGNLSYRSSGRKEHLARPGFAIKLLESSRDPYRKEFVGGFALALCADAKHLPDVRCRCES